MSTAAPPQSPHERNAFLKAIAADLSDDTRRLAFADWLDEHTDPGRAEFIRVQCALEPIRDQYEIDRAAELHEREYKLQGEHREKWLGKMRRDWDRHPNEYTG